MGGIVHDESVGPGLGGVPRWRPRGGWQRRSEKIVTPARSTEPEPAEDAFAVPVALVAAQTADDAARAGEHMGQGARLLGDGDRRMEDEFGFGGVRSVGLHGCGGCGAGGGSCGSGAGRHSPKRTGKRATAA